MVANANLHPDAINPAKPMKPALWSFIWAELQPFEGRLAMTWRTALVCALAAMVFMIYQIPLVAIGCYLVMFLAKPTAQENVLVAVAISVLVSVVVLLLFMLTRITVEVPMWRMIVIALGSYFFIYLGAASLLGPVGNIIALVIGFVMTLLPFVAVGEIATRGILFAWLMVLAPMGVVAVFHSVAGTSSVTVLNRNLARRLRLLACAIDTDTHAVSTSILEELRKGPAELEGCLKMIRLFHLVPASHSAALEAAIFRSQAILKSLAALQSTAPESQDLPLMQPAPVTAIHLKELARLVENKQLVAATQLSLQTSHYPDVPDEIRDAVQNFFRLPKRTIPAAHKKPSQPADALPASPDSGFFKADAWSNPTYSRFAIKTTAAAIMAYIIYTSIQWQGIHTAMITCYVAALGSTGETVHKLTLRITGCLIGAALGMLSLAFIMPAMTSIGELVVLVFAGIMIAAWVSSGSERISYAGIQIGLAFLMTVLQDFKPDVEMSVATDRIYGILLGNALLFITFTQLWPNSVATTVQKNIKTSHQWLTQLMSCLEKDPLIRAKWVDKIFAELGQARETLLYNHFEPHRERAPTTLLKKMHEQIDQLEKLTLEYSLLNPESNNFQQSIKSVQTHLQTLAP